MTMTIPTTATTPTTTKEKAKKTKTPKVKTAKAKTLRVPRKRVAVPDVETAPTPPAPPRMTRARLLSPAAKRGAELVRFLRIHAKRPYGPRGEHNIAMMAREVGHLANLELEALDRETAAR